MCQSKIEKDSVFITQAGAKNEAVLQDVQKHLMTNNIVLIIIVTVIGLAIIAGLMYIYRRCHVRWLQREIGRAQYFRRSIGWRENPRAGPETEVASGVRFQYPKPRCTGAV